MYVAEKNKFICIFCVLAFSMRHTSFFSFHFVRTVSVYFSQLNNCQSNCSCYGFYRWHCELHSLSGPSWRPRPIVCSQTPFVRCLLTFFAILHIRQRSGRKFPNRRKSFSHWAPSPQSTSRRKKRFRYKLTVNIRLCMLTSNWNLRRQIPFLLPFLSPHFFVCSARHVFFLPMWSWKCSMRPHSSLPEFYRTENCSTILLGCRSEMK